MPIQNDPTIKLQKIEGKTKIRLLNGLSYLGCKLLLTLPKTAVKLGIPIPNKTINKYANFKHREIDFETQSYLINKLKCEDKKDLNKYQKLDQNMKLKSEEKH